MQNYSNADGWLIKCTGGPLDGWDIRPNPGEHQPPDATPRLVMPLDPRDGSERGRYELRPVKGKQVTHKKKRYQVYRYYWCPQSEIEESAA